MNKNYQFANKPESKEKITIVEDPLNFALSSYMTLLPILRGENDEIQIGDIFEIDLVYNIMCEYLRNFNGIIKNINNSQLKELEERIFQIDIIEYTGFKYEKIKTLQSLYVEAIFNLSDLKILNYESKRNFLGFRLGKEKTIINANNSKTSFLGDYSNGTIINNDCVNYFGFSAKGGFFVNLFDVDEENMIQNFLSYAENCNIINFGDIGEISDHSKNLNIINFGIVNRYFDIEDSNIINFGKFPIPYASTTSNLYVNFNVEDKEMDDFKYTITRNYLSLDKKIIFANKIMPNINKIFNNSKTINYLLEKVLSLREDLKFLNNIKNQDLSFDEQVKYLLKIDSDNLFKNLELKCNEIKEYCEENKK